MEEEKKSDPSAGQISMPDLEEVREVKRSGDSSPHNAARRFPRICLKGLELDFAMQGRAQQVTCERFTRADRRREETSAQND